MSVALALAAAVSWGSSDFLAGLESRRSPLSVVAVGAQLVGLLALLLVLPVLPGGGDPAAYAWGAAAGVGGGLGVTLLYRALAVGRMSLVAPVTAVGGATVPVAIGILRGDVPGPAALIGVVVCLAAVVLMSLSDDDGSAQRSRRGLGTAALAGVGFGAFYVLLDLAGGDAGLWPLLGAKTASVAILLGWAAASRRPVRPTLTSAPWIAAAGVLEVGGAALFLVASTRGMLAIAAVVGSLYPAVTVLLARATLQERSSRLQRFGMAVAAVGLVLVVTG